jgi:hypothetical protein
VPPSFVATTTIASAMLAELDAIVASLRIEP